MKNISNIIINKNPVNMIFNIKTFILENKNSLTNLNNISNINENLNTNFIPNNVKFMEIKELNEYLKSHQKLDYIGKMVYNLCSIEYMAVISYLSTYYNFINYKYINDDYLKELIDVIIDETTHFWMVNNLLNNYYKIDFGIYPINSNILKDLNFSNNCLIKRICMISLVNEVRGVDSGDFLLNKLKSLNCNKEIYDNFQFIIKEEEKHVKFGIKYFKYFANKEKINHKLYFNDLMKNIKFNKMKINKEIRNKIGFDFY